MWKGEELCVCVCVCVCVRPQASEHRWRREGEAGVSVCVCVCFCLSVCVCVCELVVVFNGWFVPTGVKKSPTPLMLRLGCQSKLLTNADWGPWTSPPLACLIILQLRCQERGKAQELRRKQSVYPSLFLCVYPSLHLPSIHPSFASPLDGLVHSIVDRCVLCTPLDREFDVRMCV